MVLLVVSVDSVVEEAVEELQIIQASQVLLDWKEPDLVVEVVVILQ